MENRGFISTEFQVLAIKLLAELLTSFVQSRSMSPEDDRASGLLKEVEAFIKKCEAEDEDTEDAIVIVPPELVVEPSPEEEVAFPTPTLIPVPLPNELEQPDPPKKKSFFSSWWG